ncbi:hypothetical protein BC962_1802 [Gillisia mitskevichiae]|uniref:Histidine kinase n=1 Tax=Gillisia mitskevichiae TaxID=270921 RepID=A0A495PUV0_9FLAO|nr:histidine kinase [Gillisia mitskevichiae]RKS53550.1 hypothetical protein BC962_1802 [Gillisia mitskevichiae]
MQDISKNSSQLYRITYEAYSKFANKISRCSSLAEVGEVSKTHLKYLINYHIIRITIQQEKKHLFFSLTKDEVDYDLHEKVDLLEHEENLYLKEIPIHTTNLPQDWIARNIDSSILVEPEMWAWLFNNNGRKVTVTLISDKNKNFTAADIDILKLAIDCFEAKFHEIYLARLLDNKNKSLTEALKVIKAQNEEIQNIVKNQKEIIKERTSEILEKNKKLLHISALNAHNIREPLSRIQGLIGLFPHFSDAEVRTELVPKIESSAEEMDLVLQEVILMATQELEHLKVEKE